MRTILVTGANRGLGRAIATRLIEDNTVIILGRDEEKVQQAATDLGCDYAICDVGEWPSVQQAATAILAKHPVVDVLINCAGLYARGAAEDVDPAEAEAVFKTNALGPLLMAKAFVPAMKQRKSGHIININSQGGLYGKAERSVYHGSKWALTGITKSLEMELAPFGVRVSGIYPGALEKTMAEQGISSTRADGIPYSDVVDAIIYILTRPQDTVVSEFGMRGLTY